MNPLLELAQCGQSVWIDGLTRSLISSGELQRRVKEEGVTGVTTNPAIFRAALHAGDDYDRQIKELAAQPLNRIYETLLFADVRDACDILRPVYDRTKGHEGFVSVDISPYLAHNTQASIAEAQRFWQVVARPNLFIKIPGTFESIAAADVLLSAGINVHVTLLFCVERYEEVALAYMSALERRKSAKQPLASVASVAGFFLSQIDTVVDDLLHQQIAGGRQDAGHLLGKCAIANAKLAHQRFKELTSSARWRFVENAGARPQRLLWAGTGTKNPIDDDLTYVAPLIGSQTITSMTRDTITAFADRGRAATSLEDALKEAIQIMSDLRAAGIDLQQVTRRLLDEGIEKFIESFNDILQTIATRTMAP